MIVCSCNVLTDTKIRASISGDNFPKTPGAVYRCLGCSPNCGRCFATVRSIISSMLAETSNKTEICASNQDRNGPSFVS